MCLLGDVSHISTQSENLQIIASVIFAVLTESNAK